MELFESETKKMPAGHLFALSVCNSGEFAFKRQFYLLKNKLLEQYGIPNDYDLQTIKKECWTCGGTGRWHGVAWCRSCSGSGVFENKKVVLQRIIVDGVLFHKPIGQLSDNSIKKFVGYEEDEWREGERAKFEYLPFSGKFVGNITGTIKHKPYKLNATWAYLYLLWHYDRPLFYRYTETLVAGMFTTRKAAIRKLLQQHDPLQAFAKLYKIEREQIVAMDDDVPF